MFTHVLRKVFQEVKSIKLFCRQQIPTHGTTCLEGAEGLRRGFRPHVLCVDTGRSSETAKAHRG
eukprot:TRINITY_DN2463_c0_g1_i1.p1 TRINITY_DN2463_c0_g1~~TRINITY_DN2463_c0_g1_i1.p1  ORF type:complete len:64 (+),score=5.04 TRINITY_DN2463_c0_g1_i1:388-579(+)